MRKLRSVQAAGQAKPVPFTLPAPLKGWNTVDPEASMGPQYALTLENWIPNSNACTPRKGAQRFCSGFGDRVRNLCVYESPTVSKLFAATDSGLFEVIDGAVGAAAVALTSGKSSFVNFATVGGSFGVFVNGADDMQLFNGTTWAAVNGTSPIAITGKATSSFTQVAAHKKRLWFVEKDSSSAWYLPIAQVGGAVVEFPLGPYFTDGGYLHSIATWTLDGGDGPDDYCVFVSSRGQVAVYRGTDPSSATAWGLVGVYSAGPPLGWHPPVKFGGDLLMLTQHGLFPLSKLLSNSTIDRKNALSSAVNTALTSAATAYAGYEGWQVLILPSDSLLILNVPTTPDGQTEQYVMNLVTRAWTKFKGWNVRSMARQGQQFYFGTDNSVEKGLVGTSDNGLDIVCRGQQAYSSLGYGGAKNVTLFRPHLRLSDVLRLFVGLYSDYRLSTPFSEISVNLDGAAFDQANFDEAVFAQGFENKLMWCSSYGEPAYRHSFCIETHSSVGTLEWVATDFLSTPSSALV